MSPAQLLAPDEVAAARERARDLLAGLDTVLYGQERLTHLVLVALLARGHVLIEGPPGLGKTELVKGLAALVGLEWRRVQFTPDLLPGDVTGGPVLEEQPGGGRRLVFQPGPVFTHLLLADEINRAGPKTQSALLEAMAERRVTSMGETRSLPDPFYVLATQNPIELEGTYPLPEAQLDRFLFKLVVPRLDRGSLERLVVERRRGEPPRLAPRVDAASLAELFAAVERVHLPRPVANWIARLVEATHPDGAQAPEAVRRYVRAGASPRAAIALAESARAHALVAGKPGVGFDDVRALAQAVLAHRLVLDHRARLEGVDGTALCEAVLAAVPELEVDGAPRGGGRP